MCPTSATVTPVRELEARRLAVFEALGDGVMVLPGAAIQFASRDTERPYVPDRELFYLTSLVSPGCVAVLRGGAEQRLDVFSPPRDPDAELWSGPRLDPDDVCRVSGADDVHPIEKLASLLPGMLESADRIHARLGAASQIDHIVVDALRHARSRGPRRGTGPRGVTDPGEILDELRLRKSAYEVDLIRAACDVTLAGHRAAARVIAEGVGEWVVEAELERGFRAGGATRPGFDSIVGGGDNACVLHYVANNATIPSGGLVLVDAGAECGLYNGDVTRTYPANGRFRAEQREVYELVDRARRAAISAIAPGVSIAEVHDASSRVLTGGLVDLGILSGDVSELIEEGRHRDFFPHQTSHWLGLDVHDPGDYELEGRSRALEVGMVLTVEPGLYFRPQLCKTGAKTWSGIGIRIEDDVVVTDDGAHVLTSGLPTAIDDIEDMVGQ